MKSLKFPNNIAIVDRVDSNSIGEDRERQFPIMSVSKSFCGAVSVLMALDGKFGDKGVDATLIEVLDIAKNSHPERTTEIEKYQKVFLKQNIGDIRISELLTHRSGIMMSPNPAEFYQTKSFLEIASENFRAGEHRGNFAYSNTGYELLQEIINLSSDSGNYQQELQARIFDKCQMTNSGNIYESEALTKITPRIDLDPSGDLHEFDETTKASHAFGRIPLAAGGVSSTINDLEKFGHELVLLIDGKPNLLTDNSAEKAAQAAEIYTRHTTQNHYSLGIEINRNENLTISHGGNLPTNRSQLKVTLKKSSEIKSENFCEQLDCLTIIVQNEPLQMLDKTLRQQLDKKLNEEERIRFEHTPNQQIENYLIEQERLPAYFTKDRTQIFSNFKSELDNFLKKNFCALTELLITKKSLRIFKIFPTLVKLLNQY